jgi:nicotinate phosphoribosyltransferase
MNRLAQLYRPSLALLTDLYQLTMAYGYWKLRRHEQQAVFHLQFRNNPFDGGFAIACGLEDVAQFIENFRFDDEDLKYLAGLRGNDSRPIFDSGFIDALRAMEFRCDLDAIAEGTAVFANEPLLRVTGPIMQCQLLETPLLTMINFQTLIATKAARVCLAAGDDPVIEFGLRRAQGIDGGLSASRAAYIGGCAGTSNTLAGRIYDIPVKGTHAHSWVMSFPDEKSAFEAYAEAMPNNCVFLVDTYNTRTGVAHAAEVAKRLKQTGHHFVGIRLDSGDLAFLSMEARKALDAAGLTDAHILASNDLDEHLIEALKSQGAAITEWGVGTKLVTAYDQPALGGVYKLSAIRDNAADPWQYKLKLSEQLAKISTPGIPQVRRFYRAGTPVEDAVYCETLGIADRPTIVDPKDPTRTRAVEADATHEDLLVPIFRHGQREYSLPAIHDIRARCRAQVQSLHAAVTRFVYPHEYPVGLESRLAQLRVDLIRHARAASQ